MIRQSEPKLSKVNAVKIIFCSLALFVQAELQMISELDDEYIFFSQHSRKPNVGGSPNLFDHLSFQNFHHFFDSIGRLDDCELSLSLDFVSGLILNTVGMIV